MTAYRFLPLFAALIILTGCGSNPDPLQPSADLQNLEIAASGLSLPGNQSTANHALWGLYTLQFDLENLQVEVIPDRVTEAHVNITNLINSPSCNECITLEILEHNFTTRTIRVKVTLKNSTKFSGYDVRGIILPRVAGVSLRNADGYTTLWNSGAHETRNPYRAFAQGVAQREFPPDYYDYRTYQISYYTPDSLFKIGYAIDVSWPDNCPEPYAIEIPEEPPILAGTTPATIQIDIKDWQNDIDWVIIYPFPLMTSGFLDTMDVNHLSGDTWSVTLSNTNNAHPASYYLWIRAKSQGSDIFTWHKLKVTIQPEAPPPPPDTTDVQVRFYVAANSSGSLPYFQQPGGGQQTFTYSIASSQRSWANIFWHEYGINLVDTGAFMIMDDSGSDASLYYLDNDYEILQMHESYGKKYAPDALSMYFVQGLPPGMYTAFCVLPLSISGIVEHNSVNVFHVYSPNVWFWQEAMAHESGHAFGALEDIYLLIPEIGFDCAALKSVLPSSLNYLYCDDFAYYEGNLMWFAMGWNITQYDLTSRQADWVEWFNETYPNNW